MQYIRIYGIYVLDNTTGVWVNDGFGNMVNVLAEPMVFDVTVYHMTTGMKDWYMQ